MGLLGHYSDETHQKEAMLTTAELKGKGEESVEIARLVRLYVIYFSLDPLVIWLLFPINHV